MLYTLLYTTHILETRHGGVQLQVSPLCSPRRTRVASGNNVVPTSQVRRVFAAIRNDTPKDRIARSHLYG